MALQERTYDALKAAGLVGEYFRGGAIDGCSYYSYLELTFDRSDSKKLEEFQKIWVLNNRDGYAWTAKGDHPETDPNKEKLFIIVG